MHSGEALGLLFVLFWFAVIAISAVTVAVRQGMADPQQLPPGQGRRVRAPRRKRGRPQRMQVLAALLTRGDTYGLPGGRIAAAGKLDGRSVKISVASSAAVASAADEVVYEVPVSDRALRLDVLQGVAGFAKYEIVQDLAASSQQLSRAFELVNRFPVKSALGTLFMDQGCSRLELREGLLVASRPATDSHLVPARGKRFLRTLFHIAREAERTAHELPADEVKLIHPGSVEDYQGQNCPYCRDVLLGKLGGIEQLVSCEVCATVLHGECFGELGKCTTTGCGGRRGLPVLTRERDRVSIKLDLSACALCGSRREGCTAELCRAGGRARRPGEYRRIREGARRRRGD